MELHDRVLEVWGDGQRVPCVGCGEMLARETLTLDHFPIPNCMGGTYRMDNVRPMCEPCNANHKHTPTREWVEGYCRDNGIMLRKHGCPQYSAEYYQNHRASHQDKITTA